MHNILGYCVSHAINALGTVFVIFLINDNLDTARECYIRSDMNIKCQNKNIKVDGVGGGYNKMF